MFNILFHASNIVVWYRGFYLTTAKIQKFLLYLFLYKLETRNINLHASKTKVERVHI